jgi:transposase-like protein
MVMPSAPSPRTSYSTETKAAALAALLEGQSVSAVARTYNIPKGTVSAWKQRRAATLQPTASDDADAATQKRDSIGDLLLTLVETNLRGLIAASAVMQDAEWVRKQDASELGVFLGITHDKVVRMLEAMDASAAPEPPAQS